MKALYDFESGGPNELSFVSGEVLTVVEKVCTECIAFCILCILKLFYCANYSYF